MKIHLKRTNAGLITAIPYDDGVAEGVQILLEGRVVAMLDVYKPVKGEPEGEARVLVYHVSHSPEFGSPDHCFTINR